MGVLSVRLLFPMTVRVVEILVLPLFGKDLYLVFFWDIIRFLFSLIVLTISCSVFFYASYYIDNEVLRVGFIVILLSFVLSIILLLFSPRLVTLLLGWDGLGITSYLLVIYYRSYSSSTAGILTFLVNRLGDVFFLLALGGLIIQFDREKPSSHSLILGGLIVIAFSTKSAQLPFSAWLPAAIAAPTPVSSLVHSSTLVTAGLYLIIRFSYILEPLFNFILWGGVLTLLAAGLMAVFEWDLKKLIAFSTLSQLGFMVSSFGIGLIWVRFFHLLTHALFKASLFLSAGALIHNADSRQEFRNILLIPFQLFWLRGVINICLLCLCGIPFTRGFYSKDIIVDGGAFREIIFFLYLLGVCLTVVYRARFFLSSHRSFGYRSSFYISYEKVLLLFIPLSFLVLLAIWGGWFFFEAFFSFRAFILISRGWKSLYFLSLILFFILSFIINRKMRNSYPRQYFFSSIWFLKILSRSFYWRRILRVSSFINPNNDQGFLEIGGPQGMFFLLVSLGRKTFYFQSFIFVIYFLIFLSFLMLF